MKTRFIHMASAAVVLLKTNAAFAASGGPAADAAHHGAKASSGGLPQLDPTWYASQIFWLTIVFVVLYTIFSKSVLPALADTIESRRERIQSDLDSARNMKDEAESVHESYEKILSDARTKASDLFTGMEADIKRKTANELGKIRNKSLEEIQKTEARINKEKDKALSEMGEIAAEIASMAAEKIVGIPADIKQAKSVVENISKKAA